MHKQSITFLFYGCFKSRLDFLITLAHIAQFHTFRNANLLAAAEFNDGWNGELLGSPQTGLGAAHVVAVVPNGTARNIGKVSLLGLQ